MVGDCFYFFVIVGVEDGGEFFIVNVINDIFVLKFFGYDMCDVLQDIVVYFMVLLIVDLFEVV